MRYGKWPSDLHSSEFMSRLLDRGALAASARVMIPKYEDRLADYHMTGSYDWPSHVA